MSYGKTWLSMSMLQISNGQEKRASVVLAVWWCHGMTWRWQYLPVFVFQQCVVAFVFDIVFSFTFVFVFGHRVFVFVFGIVFSFVLSLSLSLALSFPLYLSLSFSRAVRWHGLVAPPWRLSSLWRQFTASCSQPTTDINQIRSTIKPPSSALY